MGEKEELSDEGKGYVTVTPNHRFRVSQRLELTSQSRPEERMRMSRMRRRLTATSREMRRKPWASKRGTSSPENPYRVAQELVFSISEKACSAGMASSAAAFAASKARMDSSSSSSSRIIS